MDRLVLFDWGDTVMRVFPEYRGPMAQWPEVEALPGVEKALQTLSPTYRLVVATNAADSGSALVWVALARAGLDGYFDAVFTAQELGIGKSNPLFFHIILHELGVPLDRSVMVGDSYQPDVTGAKEAGLRAVWLNSMGFRCPATHPAHDAEIQTMDELPGALDRMNLPDMRECMALLQEYEIDSDALRHCQAVAAVGYRLAVRLKKLGEPVDPLLVHRGGLLHDLGKLVAERVDGTHGQVGAQILRSHGYPDTLAAIVESHLILAILDPAHQASTWEEKIVYYVDKIVEQDEVVGVPKRMEALHLRYPQQSADLNRSLPLVLGLEAEICDRMGLSNTTLLDSLSDWRGSRYFSREPVYWA
jgi:putative hydrolase of the HAD superfamily